MSDAPRDDKGRLLPGNSLRSVSRKKTGRKVSRALKREYIKRYSVELGPERATLKHYFVLMDIMQNPGEKAQDRTKAAIELANRMDGKPVDELELSGSIETGTPLDNAVTKMTPEQLLELVRTARGH